jgi:hypothetical protein
MNNRYRNSVRLSTMTVVIAITLVALFVTLSRVAERNRVHALGDEQRQIEREVRLLKQELAALDLRIESLLTRDKVQPRLAGARTLLRPITKDRLIELAP